MVHRADDCFQHVLQIRKLAVRDAFYHRGERLEHRQLFLFLLFAEQDVIGGTDIPLTPSSMSEQKFAFHANRIFITQLRQYHIIGQGRFASEFCVLTRRGFAVILDVLP